ncbi:hypothetical protein D068_cds27830 [Bacillus atrophaeus UCMB-5137]|nr:hypothetical protein D068_cds27830 [Bacillus atrophaeus UCMB-5137]
MSTANIRLNPRMKNVNSKHKKDLTKPSLSCQIFFCRSMKK